MYFVYILRSIKDGKNCIGFTKDLNQRLSQHNSGKVRSTRLRKPFILIYSETYKNEQEAVNREKYFKTHKGYNELKRIGIYRPESGAVG